RARPPAAARAKAPHPRPDGTTFAPTWQSAVSRPFSASAEKRPSPRRATSSRKTRSTGSSAQKERIWPSVGSTSDTEPSSHKLLAMPIHLRGEPGDYADGCLLPGDPLRAKYIAETFFDDPVEVNHERGML